MTAEKMETINQAGLATATRVARRVSIVVGCILALATVMFLAWDSYFRVAAGVQAVSEQLSHLLTVGDTFQLKTQLLSLSSSGIVDQFQLKEPGGTVLAGFGVNEGSQLDAKIESRSSISIKKMPNGLSVLQRYEIANADGQKSTLIVTKKLHVEFFALLLLIEAIIFYFIHSTFRSLVLRFASDLTNPITELAAAVVDTSGADDLASNDNLRSRIRYLELNQTLDSFLKLLTRLKNEESLRIQAEKDATLAAVASHVAHDVRSPLAALNMAIQSIDQISEDDRVIIQAALQRINDISNELLSKSMSSGADLSLKQLYQPTSQRLMIAAVVGPLLNEKRMQYRGKSNVVIKEELSNASGLYVNMASAGLARVISNLVNNAVEAMDDRPGEVHISVDGAGDEIKVVIRDNGKGIPKEILDRLGEIRLSHDKSGSDSGSGFGVRYARTFVESAGGRLQIESQVGVGTSVTLIFPRSNPATQDSGGLIHQSSLSHP